MRNLAIIPARGGSKRLPRKNLLPFMGKPILIWTAEAARNSGCFEQIVISTEDVEIASVAKKYGFAVHTRPHALATDQVSVSQVCLHLLETLEGQGVTYDAICCLYATAPLRTAQDILSVMNLLGDDSENLADFAFAVTDYSHSPYQMLVTDSRDFLVPAWPLFSEKKSQEVPRCCAGNGSTYAARVPAFKLYGGFYGSRMRGYHMDRLRSVDIDTAEDFELATWAARWLQERERG